MTETAWPDAAYSALTEANVRQVAYVPDAGLARLIALPRLRDDAAGCLTTEEEAWRWFVARGSRSKILPR